MKKNKKRAAALPETEPDASRPEGKSTSDDWPPPMADDGTQQQKKRPATESHPTPTQRTETPRRTQPTKAHTKSRPPEQKPKPHTRRRRPRSTPTNQTLPKRKTPTAENRSTATHIKEARRHQPEVAGGAQTGETLKKTLKAI